MLLIWQQHRTKAPMYDGRPVSEWVRMAFSEGRPRENPVNPRQSGAWRKVAEIGGPAVPYVARSLTDANHRFLRRTLEWLRWHLPAPIRWKERSSCVVRHHDALALLREMGEAAGPAVSEVVRCFRKCPCAHYMDGMACIEWLGDAGTMASNALPFLVGLSRGTNSHVLAAAVAAYYVSGEADQNILVEAFGGITHRTERWISSKKSLSLVSYEVDATHHRQNEYGSSHHHCRHPVVCCYAIAVRGSPRGGGNATAPRRRQPKTRRAD